MLKRKPFLNFFVTLRELKKRKRMNFVKDIKSKDWKENAFIVLFEEHGVEDPHAIFYERTIEGEYLEIPISISVNEQHDVTLHNNLTSEGKVEIK